MKNSEEKLLWLSCYSLWLGFHLPALLRIFGLSHRKMATETPQFGKKTSRVRKVFTFVLRWFSMCARKGKSANWGMKTHLLNKLRHSKHWSHMTAVYTDCVFTVSQSCATTRLVRITTTDVCRSKRMLFLDPIHEKNHKPISILPSCTLPLVLLLVSNLYCYMLLISLSPNKAVDRNILISYLF